jgi:glucose 1-dehydrogenase
MKLRNKTAVITGASRGIGRATALEFAKNGANVVFSYLDHDDEAASVVDLIKGAGRQAIAIKGDVADRAFDERVFAKTKEHFGGVDILVNNAATGTRKSFVDLTIEEVERTWAVTLWGVFHCSQLAARLMIKAGRGGAIINISSIHAFRPYALSTEYNAAKAAVNQMGATWAIELAQHKIRVNTIEPGWIDTPGEREAFTEKQLKELGEQLPLKRLGRPEEVAKGVLFLASDEDSSYVTGSVLRIDGGMVLPYNH